MQLISSKTYLADLIQQMDKAQKRIVITAMLFAHDEQTAPLHAALAQAAERGVTVTLAIDSWGAFFLSRAAWRQTRQAYAELATKDAEVLLLPHRGLNPYGGRSHIKATVIDDTVYSFGGINLDQGTLQATDYMLKTTDHLLANRLVKIIRSLTSSIDDQQFTIDAHHTVLIDGGQRRTSVIYDTACDLARQAQKIYVVSQWSPSGKLASILRQKKAVCYFNRLAQSSFPANIGLIADQTRFGVKNHYRRPEYLHAKFILFEDTDGRRTLLSGSHNFSWRGVAFGTKETALLSTDPILWQQIYRFFQQNIV